jgi:hypothetical protein
VIQSAPIADRLADADPRAVKLPPDDVDDCSCAVIVGRVPDTANTWNDAHAPTGAAPQFTAVVVAVEVTAVAVERVTSPCNGRPPDTLLTGMSIVDA